MFRAQFVSCEPFLHFHVAFRSPVVGSPVFLRRYRGNNSRFAQGNVHVGLLISLSKGLGWLVLAIGGHGLQRFFGTLFGGVFHKEFIEVGLVPFHRPVWFRRAFVMMEEKAFLHTTGDRRARICFATAVMGTASHSHQSEKQKQGNTPEST